MFYIKKSIADPNTSSSRQQLAMAVKQVTESINAVVNQCLGTNNPVFTAQRECDNALRDIETTRTIVQANNPNEELNSGGEEGEQSTADLIIITEPPTLNHNRKNTPALNSYYDCLEQIIDKSRLLGESMTGIANSCKNPTNPTAFAKYIQVTTNSICGLVETAAHSAYIIGVSDVESKQGRAEILDAGHFINCSEHIQDTCHSLQSLIVNEQRVVDMQLQKQQLIQAATQIAHSTASLCNASQQASSRTNNILAKRHFVQSAKQVANATANFVKSIKSLDCLSEQPSEHKQEQYQCLVRPLLESVDSLCQYALSPEFASKLLKQSLSHLKGILKFIN